MLSNLVTLTNVEQVTLHGLVFEFSRDLAVSIRDGADVRVAACIIRNGGGDAIGVSGEKAHTVFGCDIYQMGGGGISLSGGNRETLTCRTPREQPYL